MIAEIFVLIIIMGAISFFQIRQIYKDDGLKAVMVYSLFMGLATLVGALLLAGLQLQGQSVVDRLFEPIGKAVSGS
ncbi:hypothetical protein [Ruminiclostridium cellobioparum]|jgi:hypothetical protein|uniref:Uncharacterized protein n=1 Tax=Ruminiclostridium cellobioparum subsp. termitidis CT1112 TaxID=1195236 RepID=S0FXL6_RUMCE|nr:hypothetical protein [Ruminiclostridium cellobioparum]EMS73318.1 hypothetical protein CTER_0799 [Ruminiclostridium cellobioparum subsp. termitidis CT1112]